MKKQQLLYIALAGFLCAEAGAQFHVQSNVNFFMQSGAIVSIDGLTLLPSIDHTLNNLTISRSGSAITSPEPGGQSIARVYNFSTPPSFTGTVGIMYLQSELNGLTESSLQLATRSAIANPFVKATNSTVDPSDNYVRAVYASAVSLGQVTALASDGSLPVTLADFEVIAEGRSAYLRWSTTYEENSSHFDVLHSLNARQWSSIGQVSSQRNSTLQQRYHYTHTTPLNSLNYYRLRMVDLDGTDELSEVRSVRFSGITGTGIFPNPVNEVLSIRTENWDQVTSVILYNHRGVVVYQSKEKPEQNINVQNLPSGVYMLRLTQSNSADESYKVVLGQ